jgi:hypothetical protein
MKKWLITLGIAVLSLPGAIVWFALFLVSLVFLAYSNGWVSIFDYIIELHTKKNPTTSEK